MGLSKWDIPTLRKNLSDMERFLHSAGSAKLSLSPIHRRQGEAQYPIFAKVVAILREELDDRLRAAEDIEYLGRAIAEIEKVEAREATRLEEEHPEVVEGPQWVTDPQTLRIDIGGPHSFTTPSAKLHIHSDGTVGIEDPAAPAETDPILQAMKNATWDGLQRLGTDLLVEYLEEVWIKKHHDYGPENHAIWGCQGALIRMCDKLMRLKGYYFDERSMMTGKVQSDWQDLMGYALIGLIIERGLWPVAALSEVIETMKAEYEDDAFAYVIADMKAKAEAPPVPPLECPDCGSRYVRIYQGANTQGYERTYCGMECDSCRADIGTHLHLGRETLEDAVRRGIQEWQESNN